MREQDGSPFPCHSGGGSGPGGCPPQREVGLSKAKRTNSSGASAPKGKARSEKPAPFMGAARQARIANIPAGRDWSGKAYDSEREHGYMKSESQAADCDRFKALFWKTGGCRKKGAYVETPGVSGICSAQTSSQKASGVAFLRLDCLGLRALDESSSRIFEEQIARYSGKSGEKLLVEGILEVQFAAFPGFFLTSLGKGFLRQMYKSYLEHQGSGILVALDNGGKVLGFCAFSEDMSGLYEQRIRKHLLAFAWYALWAVLRKPSILARLFRALGRPKETRRNENYIELGMLGVLPGSRRLGIGANLVRKLKETTDWERNSYIVLQTDAVGNDEVLRFYEANGFQRFSEYTTHEGRHMFEYRFAMSFADK